jgi:hypothetical protein
VELRHALGETRWTRLQSVRRLDLVDSILRESRLGQLREDRHAAGDRDQLFDPSDAGNQRIVPLLEEDTRALGKVGRGAKDSLEAVLESAREILGPRLAATRAPTIRITCRVSATVC